MEVGRSCTHADYRNGTVIMLLWSGLAEYLRRGGYQYVLGCASVSLRDDGVTAAEVWRTISKQLPQGDEPYVEPLHRVEKLNSTLPARVPPLIKGYLKLGARVCGQPAWDPDFNAADFPVLLKMDGMDERYRRHFGLDQPAPTGQRLIMRRLFRRMKIKLIRRATRPLRQELRRLERQTDLSPFDPLEENQRAAPAPRWFFHRLAGGSGLARSFAFKNGKKRPKTGGVGSAKPGAVVVRTPAPGTKSPPWTIRLPRRAA